MVNGSINDAGLFPPCDATSAPLAKPGEAGIAEQVAQVSSAPEVPVILQNLNLTSQGWVPLEAEERAQPEVQACVTDVMVEPGETLLIHAVKTANQEIVKWLLDVPGVNANARDSYGRTALDWANHITDREKRDAIIDCLSKNLNHGMHGSQQPMASSVSPDASAAPSLADAYLADLFVPPAPVMTATGTLTSTLSVDVAGPRASERINAQSADCPCTSTVAEFSGAPDAGAESEAAPGFRQQKWIDASLDEMLIWLECDDCADVVNLRDHEQQTALIWAARQGAYRIVDALLALPQIDVNAIDNEGGTALSWAASHGGETGLRCVESLLRHRDIDIWLGRPLAWAQYYGHGKIADRLLQFSEQDRTLQRSKSFSGTQVQRSLLCAARAPAVPGTSLLQENPPAQLPGSWTRACLPDAAPALRMSHEPVCQEPSDGAPCLIFPERKWCKKMEEKIDLPGWVARYQSLSTPRKLSITRSFSSLSLPEKKRLWIRHAIGDNLQTIQFFRAAQIEPEIYNERNAMGETALCVAVDGGHLAVIEELLSIQYVNVNLDDYQGNTPLKLALRNGNRKIVDLLLQRKDLDLNAVPVLLLAARNACAGIVKSLLQDGRVNVNQMTGRMSALSAAAEKGHEGIIGMLMARSDIDMDAGEPLMQAIKGQHLAVVQLLLKDQRISVNNLHLATAEDAYRRYLYTGTPSVSRTYRSQRADAVEILKQLRLILQERAGSGLVRDLATVAGKARRSVWH